MDDEKINRHFEAVAGYASDIDLKLIALEETICDLFEMDEEKRKEFQKVLAEKFNQLLQIRMEQSEDIDPKLAARIFRGRNPYDSDASGEEEG
jgi:hypothetical protein